MTTTVPTETAQNQETTHIHDFASKLLQPSILPRLKEYVRVQAEIRRRAARDGGDPAAADFTDLFARLDDVPVSVNLDLTTACNYKCDHCVDLDILNTGIRYDHDKLKDSLARLARRGLRSVIVIGGGEPTVYPGFGEIIRFMKSLKLAIGIVSNGSGNRKIAEVADCLDAHDWARLSLDSGTDETFQAMHKPRKPVSLDQICESVAEIKDKNPAVAIGYSFIITWKGAEINDFQIHPNIHEMVMATERARRYRFDYISFKPFLTRAEANNAEVIGLDGVRGTMDELFALIRRNFAECKKLETPGFRVIESTNLRVLMDGSFRSYMQQPRNCHMQWFRQVISPLGLFNCPVYRNQPHGRLGHKHSYSEEGETRKAQIETLKLVQSFDASEQCKEVTCLYNRVNWFIEDLVRHPEKLERLEAVPERGDYFL
jgi:MoaA/NifB/PqqE/SkfB family radical SAM enzyme